MCFVLLCNRHGGGPKGLLQTGRHPSVTSAGHHPRGAGECSIPRLPPPPQPRCYCAAEAALLEQQELDGHGRGVPQFLCGHACSGTGCCSPDVQLGCIPGHAGRVSAVLPLIMRDWSGSTSARVFPGRYDWVLSGTEQVACCGCLWVWFFKSNSCCFMERVQTMAEVVAGLQYSLHCSQLLGHSAALLVEAPAPSLSLAPSQECGWLHTAFLIGCHHLQQPPRDLQQ